MCGRILNHVFILRQVILGEKSAGGKYPYRDRKDYSVHVTLAAGYPVYVWGRRGDQKQVGCSLVLRYE
jgi:hypothetical protein